MSKKKGPRVLLFDVETAPILGYVWGIWEQNVALNQIKADWHLLSWSAKWLGDSKVMYQDQRKAKNVEDDKKLLEGIWKLLNEADIVVTQNGKSFDQKKLNARFIMNGFQPPSSFKHIDTLLIARKHFGFTSNKLEYMSEKLCTKYKKLKVKEFQGFDLWKQCLAGNIRAWKQMELYNRMDVLALEELYTKLIPWDNTINFSVYYDEEARVCTCGGKNFVKNGFTYSSAGKYQRYSCGSCGSEGRGSTNEFSKLKRESLLRKVTK
jgi:DNA polymerase elongation subunit (family B)